MSKLVQRWLPPVRTPDGEELPDVGATMMEYALIVGAVALVVVLGATLFGEALSQMYDSFRNAF